MHGLIATPAQEIGPWARRRLCGGNFGVEPVRDMLEDVELDRTGLPSWGVVCGPYALENLLDEERLGRIDETMVPMPAGQPGQADLQRARRQRRRVVSQVLGNGIRRGGERSPPLQFEVTDRGGIRPPGVGTIGKLEIQIDVAHGERC